MSFIVSANSWASAASSRAKAVAAESNVAEIESDKWLNIASKRA